MESSSNNGQQDPHTAPRSSALLSALRDTDIDVLLEDLASVRVAKNRATERERAARVDREQLTAEEEAIMSLIALRRALDPRTEDQPFTVRIADTRFYGGGEMVTISNRDDPFEFEALHRRVEEVRDSLSNARLNPGAIEFDEADQDRQDQALPQEVDVTAAVEGQAALAAVSGTNAPITYGGKLTTRSLIVGLMTSRPEKLTWTARELHAELVRQQPDLTRNVVRVTLRRMLKRHEMIQIGDAYQLPEGVHQLAIATPAERAESSEAQERGGE